MSSRVKLLQSKISKHHSIMVVDYAKLHENPDGPGDHRPTALKIVELEGVNDAWKGRIVVITGCSSGIGIETARALAVTGATVVATARNLTKAREALKAIGSEGQLKLVEMDNNSLDSVRKASKEILQIAPKINVLINNAGIMATPYAKTKDGFESQFGVNHLSHFLLFDLLRSALAAGSKSTPEFTSRVVVVASVAHRIAKPNFDDLNFEKTEYNKWAAYGNSKTANVWFANQIDRLYGTDSDGAIHAFSLQPGGIKSGLMQHLSVEEMNMFADDPYLINVFKTPAQGAATSTFAAISPALEGKGGKYLEDCQIIGPQDTSAGRWGPGYGEWAYSPDDEARLWKVSQKLIGL